MPDATFHFPPDFKWGVATAAHQVEGQNTNNQWWAWENQKGRIAADHTAGLACNWWENAEADFDRAADMGLQTLRLSVEWSRVEIAPGQIDTAALDRYRTMLQALHDRGIEPLVTLHHFTDPLWFREKGGWLSEDAPAYFKRYVEQVVLALRDHTTLWCTINEPNVYASMGYVRGVFPPGHHDIKAASVVLRRMLTAHALAYKTIHSLQEAAQVGLAHNMRFFDPLLQDAEGRRIRGLPRLMNRAAAAVYDLWFNAATIQAVWDGLWLPPLGFSPAFATRRTLDWFGLNYYTRDRIAFDRDASDEGYARTLPGYDAELLAGGYGEMYPEGLPRAIRRVARMGIPIYVTEHGTPGFDDDQRQRGLMLHLRQLWSVIQQNMPVMRYYHWTLVDNFEWAEGWTLPFGLIEMDPETQARRHRPSADLYTAVARSNAITPEMIDAYTPELRPVLLP